MSMGLAILAPGRAVPRVARHFLPDAQKEARREGPVAMPAQANWHRGPGTGPVIAASIVGLGIGALLSNASRRFFVRKQSCGAP
jgi:hypothetical protein